MTGPNPDRATSRATRTVSAIGGVLLISRAVPTLLGHPFVEPLNSILRYAGFALLFGGIALGFLGRK